METSQSQQKIHVSVCNVQKGETLQPYCKDDTYRCPLCSYCAKESYKVVNHIANTAMVQHNEFYIFRCGLPCRGTSHFHCPYCLSTIDKRDRFVNHLVNHTMTLKSLSSCATAQQPVQAATVVQLPVQPASTNIQTTTTAQLPVQAAATVQLPVQPASTNIQAARTVQLPVQAAATAQLPVQPASTNIQTTTTAQLPVQAAATAQLPVQPASTNIQTTTTARLPIEISKAHLKSKDIITCEICNVRLRKRNLRVHLKRKHQNNLVQISQNHHLRSQCVDPKIGVFAVEKSFSGLWKPIHVIKNTWSQIHRSECELDQCTFNAQFAKRSGILPFECEHIQSLYFCPLDTDFEGHLSESTLDKLVENLWFSLQRKEDLLKKQQEAIANDTPLSVLLRVSGTETTFYVSVFEPKTSFFCRLGRVIVTYGNKKNTWHCPCTDGKKSCIHKATAKWHLFEKMPDMLKTAESSDEDDMCGDAFLNCDEDWDPAAERTIKYLMSHKKIPADLPETLITSSRDAKALNGFPTHLIPSETECTECEQHTTLGDPQLVSATAKILTSSGVVKGISTYRKTCPNCNMVYRYQDWQDGIHNFDDHMLLSVHLCLVLRNALQTHTAVSRIIEMIEYTEEESFPNKDRILQAYLSFEALTDHDYLYACVSCGYHPAVVVMDLHKKGVFSVPVSEIPNPPQSYNGEVNAQSFWDSVTMEVISRGFYPSGCKNPFVVKPSYHNWSPWIGPQTRQSDILLNTETEKICVPDWSNDVDQYLTEERLADEVLNLKLSEIKKLCKQCGIDNRGSKMDLVLRLRDQISSRATYNKVFEKVWGASGGWAVITCPCGVVYSVKFNLRAESPRDFADLLLSWKFLPNITVYDYARGLVRHMNKRCPEDEPFAIHEGRLLDHTAENIRQAAEGKLQVSLPWLKYKKEPEEKGGHPITGSVEHYCLSDASHQNDSKDDGDVLRRIEIVPELAGRLNSRCAEQLFAGMRKNNYFLNKLTPSSHVFLQRNILHHYNVRKNTDLQRVAGPPCSIGS